MSLTLKSLASADVLALQRQIYQSVNTAHEQIQKITDPAGYASVFDQGYWDEFQVQRAIRRVFSDFASYLEGVPATFPDRPTAEAYFVRDTQHRTRSYDLTRLVERRNNEDLYLLEAQRRFLDMLLDSYTELPSERYLVEAYYAARDAQRAAEAAERKAQLDALGNEYDSKGRKVTLARVKKIFDAKLLDTIDLPLHSGEDHGRYPYYRGPRVHVTNSSVALRRNAVRIDVEPYHGNVTQMHSDEAGSVAAIIARGEYAAAEIRKALDAEGLVYEDRGYGKSADQGQLNTVPTYTITVTGF